MSQILGIHYDFKLLDKHILKAQGSIQKRPQAKEIINGLKENSLIFPQSLRFLFLQSYSFETKRARVPFSSF